MPNEETTTTRRRRRNPLTDMIPSVTPTEVTPTDTQPLAPVQSNAVSALNLPENIEISLPDIASLAASSVGFSPNPSLPRVTDAQRVQDELAFREMKHAADNLRDSIKVATSYVSAAVEGTKLGKALIAYRTGVEDIRTAEVGLSKAQTRTAIAQGELLHLNEKLSFVNNSLEHTRQEYAHRLTEAMNKSERARLKAESYLAETDALFS